MKKVTLIILAAIALSLSNLNLVKAQSTHIVISEVAMGSGLSASDEFVELYNNSSEQIDVAGWKLEYKSATGTHWQTKAVVADGGAIDPKSFYVLKTSDDSLSSGLAQTGGNLRLIDKSGQVVDALGWGGGDSFEGAATAACQQPQSLTRIYDDATGVFVDSDDNFKDFVVANLQSPGEIALQEAINDNTTREPTEGLNNYSYIEISELLPDPIAPLSDSADEFIELYNPNSQSVALDGWIIKDAGGHTYVISDSVVAPYGYLALYSKQTKISLNNTGDEIELYDPTGTKIFSVPNYGSSKAGLSWAMTEDGWGWTQYPTPNNANAALLSETSEGSTKAAVAKAKKAPSSKSKAKATTKPKKAKTKSKLASAKTSAPLSQDINAKARSSKNIWTWLLVILGIGTIGYGIYEYRPEISSYIHKLKTKFGVGGKTS